ncbi:hypothetical protein [Roseateles sp.]|uniref:hypothetical protein n=1 Tax=Roseateles sp. TaxID=1971397 RepID=UPI0025FFDE8D|nr:hypothetical protein [Roseateles sp.]MBV8037347.1 hypothetical protein [Roseateles sp.]
MNSGIHHISSVNASRATGLDSFNLSYRYKPDGLDHTLYGVHIPSQLQAALNRGSVQAFSLEALPRNGLAAWLLPDSTNFVLLGVCNQDGTEELATPRTLNLARYLGGAIAVLVGATGLFLAVETHSWFALGLGVVATHALRSLLNLPQATPLTRGGQ